MTEQFYFAYGSNMNLDQMEFRCPKAEVVENVRLENYRLAFRGRNSGGGVATILPEEGSHVDGVLWRITPDCESSLDLYEGYPHLYGKEMICVSNEEGKKREVMVYTINEPYKSIPVRPSQFYLEGILEGCRQNGIPTGQIMEKVERTRKEINAAEQEKRGKRGCKKEHRER